MKRHYELIYSRNSLESLEEFSPELFEEYKANIKLENNNNSEDNDIVEDEENYKISFNLQSTIEPDYYYTALKYFRDEKDFSFLIWQDFYQFISEWLLFKGFCVRTPLRENGFINIETTHYQEHIGTIRCIWANKGMLLTTSTLTQNATNFIKENNFKYVYIDKTILEISIE